MSGEPDRDEEDVPGMRIDSDARSRVTDRFLIGLMKAIETEHVRPSDAVRDATAYVDRRRPAMVEADVAKRSLWLADGALGAEGRTTIDPYTRQLGRLVAEGRMTGDEAVALITTLAKAGATLRDPDPKVQPRYRARDPRDKPR